MPKELKIDERAGFSGLSAGAIGGQTLGDTGGEGVLI